MNAPVFNIHRINGYISSIYLFEYDHGLLLVDCGCINDVRRIVRYCEKNLGRSVNDIKLAFVSHMHPDHSGDAWHLREKYGIPLAAHPESDLWYRGLYGYIQHKLDCLMATEVAMRIKRKPERILYSRELKPDFPLQDGDALPFFPDWRAIHVPGHTAHDMNLYNPEHKIIYCADLICIAGGRRTLPLPIMFPEQMSASFDKLAALDISTILLAHSDPIETEHADEIFTEMKQKLYAPPNRLTKRVHRLSRYAPVYRQHMRSS